MRAPTLRHARLLVAAAVISTGALVAVGGAAQAAVTNDGTTQATAAASCWEAKQVDSGAASGVYWILTPQLRVPTEIYCDMTTDGGGWELVGRGRENWSLAYNGSGTPAQVAGTVTGTAAFKPRQLDSRVVDGLLGGRRLDSFSDGVRIRRAINQAGTSWQESRWKYRANSRDRWSWAFGAGYPLASATIGGTTVTNVTTYDIAADSSYKRMWTYESSNNNYVRGFNFGKDGSGSTSSSSYIYSSADGDYGTPFTQVFIRPTLRMSDLTFAAIPDSGTPAQAIKAVPKNGSLTSTWGVTGLGAGGTSENASEVQAFAQIGNVMYAGGNFTTVQKGSAASGSDKVSQPYLAAFNATTGDYIPAFKPVLNSQVKALVALPDGRLAVGGEFTKVGTVARSGLVVLDPTTGALDTSWQTTVANRAAGGSPVSVRGLDTDGTYLYATGAFTHFTKPGVSDRYAKGGARILLSNGTADGSWNPEFNGTGTALDVSDDKTRVYFSGYFTTAKSVTADRAAAFSTATGAPRITPTWQPTFSTSGTARYQQAVKEVGNKVWLGGSQHSMFSYNKGTFALENTHITKSGGDIQAITAGNGLVFAGCHCLNWVYEDTAAYDSTKAGSTDISWSQADRIFFVGAWDPASGDYVPDFTPELKARQGRGAWALHVATDGTLWAGGTFTSAVKENGSNGWVGGFVRFAPRPHTAPGTPANLKVVVADGAATVSWGASSTSGVSYEVLRNDRVVATSTTTTATVPGVSAGDRFFVRAVDSWGNRSASTPVTVATTGSVTTTLVPAGATWSYYFDNTAAVAGTWKTDSGSWATGAAPLGWGTGSIATNIDVAAGQTRALTSYYRRSFTVADTSALKTVKLTTRADDGVAVYVNGTEVGRSNLPAGVLAASTYASSAPSTATAIANEVTFDIPVALLQAGANSIAVEVHSNYRTTPSSSMDLRLVATS